MNTAGKELSGYPTRKRTRVYISFQCSIYQANSGHGFPTAEILRDTDPGKFLNPSHGEHAFNLDHTFCWKWVTVGSGFEFFFWTSLSVTGSGLSDKKHHCLLLPCFPPWWNKPLNCKWVTRIKCCLGHAVFAQQ